jgi:hypothetical protein
MMRTFLAAVYEKSSRILKIGFFLGVIGREDLRSPQRGPITREHASGNIAVRGKSQTILLRHDEFRALTTP